MKKEIGVVLATYNGEKYLKDQIQSILNQSCPPDYLVISDGGSSDNTVQVCQDVLKGQNLSFKILVSEEQLKVSENFERGLRHCKGDYIFFCDQDDYWLPNKIESVVKAFEKDEEIVMVFTNAELVDENLSPLGQDLWNSISFSPNTDLLFEMNDEIYMKELCRHNIVTGMCLAIKSSIIDDLLPFSLNGIHDVWIAHISITLGKVYALNEKTVLYRQHSNNVVGATSSIAGSLSHMDGYYGRVLKRYNFIVDVISRITVVEDHYLNYYANYHRFIEERMKFLQGNRSFWFIFQNLENYSRFEHRYKQIILKDLIINRKISRKEKGTCQ